MNVSGNISRFMSEQYYITTAIDYVNGLPHLGHAYEKVLTDVLARYQRRHGQRVFFLTGLDEHGIKVQQSAQKQGRDPQEFCDAMAANFERLYRKLNVSFDDFVRTTQPRHKEVVRRCLQQLFDAGEIYKGVYKGFYSPRQEQFLTEKDRAADGHFPEIFGEVIELEEDVYYFRLARHQEWLVGHLQKNPDWIFPSFRAKEVLGALENPIPDLCISRPKARLAWGIPLPFDAEQVTYVWFDALINYISVIGYDGVSVSDWWPGINVIGKDILVPAHAVYWPIMLKALGLPLPRMLLVHGWWTQNKEKMSKSTGNAVDPLTLIETYGVDAFRYFVMREMAVGYDADFSPEQFHLRYQSELGNTLGNLVNRAVSMVARYRGGAIPAVSATPTVSEENLRRDVTAAIAAFCENMDKIQVHIALMELWKGIIRINQYADENAPWKLAKNPADADRLDAVLSELAAAIYLLTGEIGCILPATAEKILAQLGNLPPLPVKKNPAWPQIPADTKVGKAEPLFPRVELPGVAVP
ncbi:MAG: methionine--tRNA ligase [Verrucomicrobiales bacterium]|nr:methionine--tRNA ligase [Verrucomicrobiales bacterium]